jgi:hypothetical protein
MSEEQIDSIFNQSEKLLGSPKVYDSEDNFRQMYEIESETEKNERILSNVFNKTVQWADNYSKAISFSCDPPRIAEDRKKLVVPDHTFLVKDGKTYIQFTLSPNITLVTAADPTRSIMRNGKHIEGFEMVNLLFKGKSGKLLDVQSLELMQQAKNIFSFSEYSPFASRKRAYEEDREEGLNIPAYATHPERYQEVVESGGIAFDDEILVTMETAEETDESPIWHPDSFVPRALHENAHIFSTKETVHKRTITDGDIDSERSANAQVLQLVRLLQQRFPEDGFFDFNEMKTILHDQLTEGYGRLHDKNIERKQIVVDATSTQVDQSEIEEMVERIKQRELARIKAKEDNS